MPVVKCPVPGCDYVTDDLDSSIVAALINAHSTTHQSGQCAVKAEKSTRGML